MCVGVGACVHVQVCMQGEGQNERRCKRRAECSVQEPTPLRWKVPRSPSVSHNVQLLALRRGGDERGTGTGMVRTSADLPTPPEPSTTSLYSFICCAR